MSSRLHRRYQFAGICAPRCHKSKLSWRKEGRNWYIIDLVCSRGTTLIRTKEGAFTPQFPCNVRDCDCVNDLKEWLGIRLHETFDVWYSTTVEYHTSNAKSVVGSHLKRLPRIDMIGKWLTESCSHRHWRRFESVEISSWWRYFDRLKTRVPVLHVVSFYTYLQCRWS